MKKKLLLVLALTLALLAVCACGNSKKYDSVTDFADSDQVQSEIEEVRNSLADSGLEATVTGEDNKLIYTYTYTEVTNFDGFAEALEEALEAEKDTFIDLANAIKEEVNEENPVVVVRYIDANGEEICSVEFTAE